MGGRERTHKWCSYNWLFSGECVCGGVSLPHSLYQNIILDRSEVGMEISENNSRRKYEYTYLYSKNGESHFKAES